MIFWRIFIGLGCFSQNLSSQLRKKKLSSQPEVHNIFLKATYNVTPFNAWFHKCAWHFIVIHKASLDIPMSYQSW